MTLAFYLHFLLLKQEIVHFVDDSAIALRTDVNAAILADSADGCGLVDNVANNAELWLNVTNDAAHDTARVDADLDAGHTTVMKSD